MTFNITKLGILLETNKKLTKAQQEALLALYVPDNLTIAHLMELIQIELPEEPLKELHEYLWEKCPEKLNKAKQNNANFYKIQASRKIVSKKFQAPDITEQQDPYNYKFYKAFEKEVQLPIPETPETPETERKIKQNGTIDKLLKSAQAAQETINSMPNLFAKEASKKQPSNKNPSEKTAPIELNAKPILNKFKQAVTLVLNALRFINAAKKSSTTKQTPTSTIILDPQDYNSPQKTFVQKSNDSRETAGSIEVSPKKDFVPKQPQIKATFNNSDGSPEKIFVPKNNQNKPTIDNSSDNESPEKTFFPPHQEVTTPRSGMKPRRIGFQNPNTAATVLTLQKSSDSSRFAELSQTKSKFFNSNASDGLKSTGKVSTELSPQPKTPIMSPQSKTRAFN